VEDFHLRITLPEDSCRDQRSPFMLTIETSYQKEVRRFRIAQFNGRTATLRSAESAVTGHVRSIVENKSSVPAAWTITIIPEEAKPARPTPPASSAPSLT